MLIADDINLDLISISNTTSIAPWTSLLNQIDFNLTRVIKKSQNPEQQKSSALQYLNDKYQNYIKIYTDGSKNESSTSYAIFSDDLKLKLMTKINHINSVFQAEALAILKAIDKSREMSLDPVVILTDSLSAVKAINSYNNRDITTTLIVRTILKCPNIKIAWIPSHVGIKGNEMADTLANEAHYNHNLLYNNIDKNDLITHIRNNRNKKNQEIWQNSNEKLLEIKEVLNNQILIVPHRKRIDDTFLSRLRIGHSSRTHSYLIDKYPRPGCVNCQMALTVKHILLDCNDNDIIKIKQHYNMLNVPLKEQLDISNCNIEYLRRVMNTNL